MNIKLLILSLVTVVGVLNVAQSYAGSEPRLLEEGKKRRAVYKEGQERRRKHREDRKRRAKENRELKNREDVAEVTIMPVSDGMEDVTMMESNDDATE